LTPFYHAFYLLSKIDAEPHRLCSCKSQCAGDIHKTLPPKSAGATRRDARWRRHRQDK